MTATPREHKTALDYWKSLAPRLEQFVGERRNRKVEECVLYTLGIYAYVCDHIGEEVTQHKDVLGQTGILLVLTQDALRGLYGAQCELSPVAAACLTRNILETSCNLRFIYRSDAPAKWSDRFERFKHMERYLHDLHRPDGKLSMLSENARQETPKLCPEWFNAKGKIPAPHWTADENFSSLKKLAKHVGYAGEYHTLYGLGSAFMHGSPLLENLYSSGNKVGVLANVDVCTQQTLLGIGLAMNTLRETVAFYGVPTFDDDLILWQQTWIGIMAERHEKGLGT